MGIVSSDQDSCSLCSPSWPPFRGGLRTLAGKTLVDGPLSVHYRGSASDPLVIEVRRSYQGILTEVARGLDLTLPPTIDVFLCRDLEDVERFTLEDVPEWMPALAQPFKRKLYLRRDLLDVEQRQRVDQVLRHEAAHLVMGSLPRDVYTKIPLWFHEGVAQMFAGRLFPFSWDELALRVRIWESPSLFQYTEQFPRDRYGAETAYLYSEAIIGMLMRLWGSDVIQKILKRLSTGESFHAALFGVTRHSLVWHEQRLHEEFASDRSVFLRYLYGLGGVICLLSIVPFGLVGLFRFRRRRSPPDLTWAKDAEEAATS